MIKNLLNLSSLFGSFIYLIHYPYVYSLCCFKLTYPPLVMVLTCFKLPYLVFYQRSYRVIYHLDASSIFIFRGAQKGYNSKFKPSFLVFQVFTSPNHKVMCYTDYEYSQFVFVLWVDTIFS